MSPRYAYFLLLALSPHCQTCAQERISVQDGPWHAPATWSDQVVPSPENSASVIVAHEVTLSGGQNVLIDNLVVAGNLVVATAAELYIVDGDSTDMTIAAGGALNVYGTMTGHDGVSLAGMSATNTFFHDGSVYRHLALGEGSIPVAQWHPNSTFEILGFQGNVSLHSPDWSQPFGNIMYNCPGQGLFVEFNSLLREVAGDLIILNTNGNGLRLARYQESVLTVAGDILIEGPSRVWFSAEDACTVAVGGNFHYGSTATAASYFTTTGQASVTINGDFTLNAAQRLKMASSTSAGHTDLTLQGDVHLLNGRLDALGSGTGTVIFGADNPQHVFAAPSAIHFDGNISFLIQSGADVDLHQSLITNTSGGDLVVEGTIRLGSANEDGIIQAGGGGNIQVAGAITFGDASQVIFNGTQPQNIRYPDFPTDVRLSNPSGVVLGNDVQFRNLTVGHGRLNTGGHTARLTGDLITEGTGKVVSGATLEMNGGAQQVLDVHGDTLQHILVSQQSSGTVQLASAVCLSRTLTINSAGSVVASDGNLHLLSTSEEAGATASIGSLPDGSAVTGAVTVHRFIRGAPGDHYRYISSPVINAPVASLMDDVPVTGTFSDAASGPGLPENVPSLFHYNEPAGEWEPFPVSGLSAENYFEPGMGYSFFNWNEDIDTDWDVTGVVNQGPLNFDLTYTPSVQPELSGWNLIGNPYPASVRWDSVGWIAEQVSAAIAVRDDLSGSFRYWDGQAGSLTGGLIAAGQAFWVRTVGAGPALSINEKAKAPEGAAYYRRRVPGFVELSVTTGVQQDRAYVRIREKASEDLDEFDAPKLRNDSLAVSFRTKDNVKVAIDAIPDYPQPSGIPLMIEGSGTGRNIVVALRAEGDFREASFSLADTVTGESYDLRNPVIFAGTADLSGLRLVIVPATSVVTALTERSEEKDRVSAFPVPCKTFLQLRYPYSNAAVSVYTASGKRVANASVHREEGGCLVNLSHVPSGSYLVCVEGEGNPVTLRVVKE